MFPRKIENDTYAKFGGKEVCYGNVEEVNCEKILATFTQAKFSPIIRNLHNQTIESINVINKLASMNVKVISVPGNMTHFFHTAP